MALVAAIGHLAPELVATASMTAFLRLFVLEPQAPVVQLLTLTDGACDEDERNAQQQRSVMNKRPTQNRSVRNKMPEIEI